MDKIDKYLKEENNNDIPELDILDKIEIENLIKETKEYMEDDELSENAANIVWDKKSIEKFGKTISSNPNKHGFFDTCVLRMKGKKGFGEEGAKKFCASILDKYKGTTSWRKGRK